MCKSIKLFYSVAGKCVNCTFIFELQYENLFFEFRWIMLSRNKSCKKRIIFYKNNCAKSNLHRKKFVENRIGCFI